MTLYTLIATTDDVNFEEIKIGDSLLCADNDVTFSGIVIDDRTKYVGTGKLYSYTLITLDGTFKEIYLGTLPEMYRGKVTTVEIYMHSRPLQTTTI